MARSRQVLLTLSMLGLSHPFFVLALLAVPVAAAAFDGWAFLVPPLAWAAFAGLGALLAQDGLPGTPLRPADEPELAALVSRLAEQLGFHAPLAMRVVPTVDASLAPTRLRGKPAYALLLGWPMLLHLDEAERSAVIAHELAHRTHVDDRGTSRLLMARATLIASMGNLLHAPAFLAQPLLAATQPTAWALELGADQDAARLTGPLAAQRALLTTERLFEAYESLAGMWEDVLGERDAYPADVYTAMVEALQDPVFLDRVDASNTRPVPDDVADSHPPIAVRVAALGAPPAGTRSGKPVRLTTSEALERRCVEMLYDCDLTPLRVLELDPDELATPVAELVPLLLSATSCADVTTALRAGVAAVKEGSWVELALRLEPDLHDAPASERQGAARMIVGSCLAQVLVDGLRRSGWQRASRWTRTALLTPDGTHVKVLEIVDLGLDTGDTRQLEQLIAAASFPGAAA